MAVRGELYGRRVGPTNLWHCVDNVGTVLASMVSRFPLPSLGSSVAESRGAATRKAALRFSFAPAGRSRSLLALGVPLAPPAIDEGRQFLLEKRHQAAHLL